VQGAGFEKYYRFYDGDFSKDGFLTAFAFSRPSVTLRYSVMVFCYV